MNRKGLVFFLGLLVFSCGSKRIATTKKTKTRSEQIKITGVGIPFKDTIIISPKVYASATEKYIDAYKNIARNEMQLYHIPASITLAQGILESGSGKGTLSIKANNHFGIKCHNWTGAKIYHDDDKRGECFRKYKNVKYSFRDHSLFLSMRKRYAKLFKLKKNDYKGWARGLKAAGYATDKKYPQKLIGLIERYELHKLDAPFLEIENPEEKKPFLAQVEHIVMKGDTLYSISKMHNITVKELQEINNLEETKIHIGQVLQINR